MVFAHFMLYLPISIKLHRSNEKAIREVVVGGTEIRQK